jgi:hypothetical protein
LKGTKIDCLSFVYVPATSAAHNRLLFFFFLLRLFTVLMKKTRAVKHSIFLDVYATTGLVFNSTSNLSQLKIFKKLETLHFLQNLQMGKNKLMCLSLASLSSLMLCISIAYCADL